MVKIRRKVAWSATYSMIYLDYLSTTPVDPRVLDRYVTMLRDCYANPSSVDHEAGVTTHKVVQSARRRIAALLECEPAEITFTSGATEAANLFLQGFTRAHSGSAPVEVISSTVEHPAVRDTLAALQQAGSIRLRLVPVDQRGCIDLQQLRKLCLEKTHLVCVMAANNETGNIYPTAEIARIASAAGAVTFCDATQLIGKLPFTMADHPDTVVVFSGHKLYAPKGIGALVAPMDLRIRPLLYGGGQQRGLRPGTLNPPLVDALALALEVAISEMPAESKLIAGLRDLLQQTLQQAIPELVVNGATHSRLPGALHISIPGIPNKQRIAGFRHLLAVSTGAACSSGSERPSHVLQAMQLPQEYIDSALRLSLGRFTTREEVLGAVDIITEGRD